MKMNKTWLVFRNEYATHVKKKGFIFGILSMPLFVVLMVLVGFVSVWLEHNSAPVSFIDLNHVMGNVQQVPLKKKQPFPPVHSLPFEDESSAEQALRDGSIQAYFLLTDNYFNSGEVIMVTTEKTGANAEHDFGDFLVHNLVKDQPPVLAERLREGPNLIIRSLDGAREMAADDWVSILMPILAGVLFVIAVNISGNYLLQAVVAEKENRTMEIIVTSISPGQLMAGKVLGNLLVGLTQLFTWFIFAIIALKLLPTVFPVKFAPRVDPAGILLIAATFLPAFVMVAAFMGAIGATATDPREAQQTTGWFTIPIVIPLWFTNVFMFNPNGALSVAMSLFPVTAPIALPFRAAFTTVPQWQIILSITLLCLLAAFALWLSGRIFRLGMLRYGKRVRLREAFSKSGSKP